MHNYRRFVVAFAISAFAAAVPIIVLLLNFSLLISSSSYLGSLEARTATPMLAEPGISLSEVQEVSDDVVAYVRGSKEQLESAQHFTSEEVSHLADVRRVIQRSFSALYFLAAAAAALAFVLFFLSSSLLGFFFLMKRAVLASGVTTLAFSLLFVVAASGSFGFLFTNFHELFFQGSQWQFPSGYLLVNLFTADFFSGFAKDIMIGTIINGVALVIAALAAGYVQAAVARSRKLK